MRMITCPVLAGLYSIELLNSFGLLKEGSECENREDSEEKEEDWVLLLWNK